MRRICMEKYLLDQIIIITYCRFRLPSTHCAFQHLIWPTLLVDFRHWHTGAQSSSICQNCVGDPDITNWGCVDCEPMCQSLTWPDIQNRGVLIVVIPGLYYLYKLQYLTSILFYFIIINLPLTDRWKHNCLITPPNHNKCINQIKDWKSLSKFSIS